VDKEAALLEEIRQLDDQVQAAAVVSKTKPVKVQKQDTAGNFDSDPDVIGNAIIA